MFTIRCTISALTFLAQPAYALSCCGYRARDTQEFRSVSLASGYNLIIAFSLPTLLSIEKVFLFTSTVNRQEKAEYEKQKDKNIQQPGFAGGHPPNY
ncbi:hypothetical protein P170DRAFT_440513 [Aspergillus steynii IBT 23096]|uniref:Secreted protein n=1 Tax=Aspergillus steynii IBT 23096 TaxID=1392250 RepID=A0A2I2FUC2_9EURO|nr:uncharacterized protein P170DRAFT_440513 [Aspergillus steynii IBT 23096]PLB44166.1 hypothetical protein P170DRAFT_440513 [Aspergillus steynii IBT 23096]